MLEALAAKAASSFGMGLGQSLGGGSAGPSNAQSGSNTGGGLDGSGWSINFGGGTLNATPTKTQTQISPEGLPQPYYASAMTGGSSQAGGWAVALMGGLMLLAFMRKKG